MNEHRWKLSRCASARDRQMLGAAYWPVIAFTVAVAIGARISRSRGHRPQAVVR